MKALLSCSLIGFSALFIARLPATAEFDQYGGWTGIQGHNTSGFFRVEKINGRYWLITPDNNVYLSFGPCVALFNDTWGGYCPTLGYYPNPYANKAKYNGTQSAWVTKLKERLNEWGFTGLACWSQSGIPNVSECVRDLSICSRASALGCVMIADCPDVWDPKYAQACTERANTLASNKNNKFTIGAFPYNELHWSKPAGYNTLPDGYIALPATAYGKQYWVNTFLKGKYATVADLNAAYGTSFTDWTGEGNTVINCTSLPDSADYPARLADKIDFMEAIADQFYRLATTAMRAADPNHLVFSTRWAMFWQGYADPYYFPFNERIWKKAGEYCDVFANNGYADFGYAETQFQHSSRVFTHSKKPFIVTEHSYLANDSYFAHTPWWLPTQMDRAVNYQYIVNTLLDFTFTDPNDGQPAKPCMGVHWFQFYDEPALGRPDGEKAQFGLLNCKDEAFLPLVEVMKTIHSQVYERCANGTPIVVPPAPTLNYAAVPGGSPFASSTLSNWPASNVCDDYYNTSWSSSANASESGTEWIAIDLGAEQAVHGFEVTPRAGSPLVCFPRDFKFQHSTDNVTWNDIPGQSYVSYPDPECVVQTFDLRSPINTRYVRMYATRLTTDGTTYYFQLATFRVKKGPTVTFANRVPTFHWNAVPEAQSYTLLMSPEDGFPEEQTIKIGGITGTTYTHTEPLPWGTWRWTVKAVDASGRGGHYAKTATFGVTKQNTPAADPVASLKCEDAAGWVNWDNSNSNGFGWAYGFRDTNIKAEGSSSMRVLLTPNSLNKLTGQQNLTAGRVSFEYKGPRFDYSGLQEITLKIYPRRVCMNNGTIVPSTRFVRLAITDDNSGTVLDTAIDPDGTLPIEQWSTVTKPLGSTARKRCTVAFYLLTNASQLTMDNRVIFNIDDLTTAPLSDLTPPTKPTVLDETYTTSTSSLRANWSSNDPESGVIEYSYAIGTTPGGSDIADWTSTGLATEVRRDGLSLALGSKYYFSVKAKNGFDMWSDVGISLGVTVVSSTTIRQALQSPNGCVVGFAGIVSAGTTNFGGLFFVQEADRSCGIKVNRGSNTSIVTQPGNRVRVAGTLGTSQREREVNNPTVAIESPNGQVPDPFYMSTSALGGSDFGPYTLSITGGTGPFNIGLLVTAFGKVTKLDAGSKYFYIDDGCALKDGSGNIGARVHYGLTTDTVVPPAPGQYALVTGISGMRVYGTKYIRQLRLRSSADMLKW